MKIRNSIMAGVAALLVSAGSAIAADMPVKAAPVPSYNWTGWYGGLNAGYGWNDATTTTVDDGSFASITVLNNTFGPGVPRTQTLDPAGFVGGGQVGHNWQFGRHWVAGFEADIQYSAVRGDASTALVNGGVDYGIDSRQDLEWFGTVRGRLGVLITERLLAYGTGGFAYGETKASATINNISILNHIFLTLNCRANSVCLAGTDSRVSTGWTAGGGLEYAAWNNVTFKIEYLHIDLGDQTVRLVAQAPSSGTSFMTTKFSNAYDIVRAGVNWKF